MRYNLSPHGRNSPLQCMHAPHPCWNCQRHFMISQNQNKEVELCIGSMAHIYTDSEPP